MDKIDELTMDDLKEDQEYLFAPHIIVTSRYEREKFNWELGKLYARIFKEPMLF